MHSWIFRHRLRLKVIYGLHFPSDPEEPEEAAFLRLPAHEPAPALPEAAESGRSGEPSPAKGPGTLVRRGRYLVLSPMRPPEL